jgi:hypothetical protein
MTESQKEELILALCNAVEKGVYAAAIGLGTFTAVALGELALHVSVTNFIPLAECEQIINALGEEVACHAEHARFRTLVSWGDRTAESKISSVLQGMLGASVGLAGVAAVDEKLQQGLFRLRNFLNSRFKSKPANKPIESSRQLSQSKS